MKRINGVLLVGMAAILLLGGCAGRSAAPVIATPVIAAPVSTDQAAWNAAIAECNELPAIRNGRGSMTLIRVFLDGSHSEDMLQLAGTKLSSPREARAGGGGMYRQIRSGDFVLVEHINSSRRKEGRDPVEIGTFAHDRAMLWLDVPDRGKLGVHGDVKLKPCADDQMGRIVVTVEGDAGLEVRTFRLGPIAVGGPYGRSIKFGTDRKCSTGPIAPGSYKILLPDFDMVKSRWTVTVEPGMTTQLRFVAESQQKVVKVKESVEPGA